MKAVLALFALAGCLIPAGSSTNDDTSQDPSAQDVAKWNSLSGQLDAHRTQFLDTHVQELNAIGNDLYWLDTTNFDPALRRWDSATNAMLGYTFSIGGGQSYNYRASASLVVTAVPGTDPVEYRAYDATQADQLIASTTTNKPSGAQWNAYAVDGNVVYIVDTSGEGSVLLKWVPGQNPSQVTTLESTGADIGEFWDFGVSGNTMVFIESGRVWKLDLSANQSKWLGNHTEASGTVDFRADGALFGTADALEFYNYAQDTLIDISAKIDANPYKVNATFATAAHYDQDFARYKQYILYIGEMGVFAYDMNADTITPVLLSPDRSDLRVDYRYPVVLDNGTTFVTGLTSTDGAVGADGPTYKVDTGL